MNKIKFTKKDNFSKLKKINGMTMLALILTIITLLTIAGITVSSISGRNGIFQNTKKATDRAGISEEKNELNFFYQECQSERRYIREDSITSEELQVKFTNAGKDVYCFSKNNSEGYNIYVRFNETNDMFLINKSGNISYLEKDYSDTKEIDKKLTKQGISYSDGKETFANPDRGFYKPINIKLAGNSFILPNTDIQEECNEAIKNNLQILHLRIDIGELSGNLNSDKKDKNLTSKQINSLNSVFNIIRQNNLDAIVRFAYSFDGTTGAEPKSFNTIIKHIKRLSSFFYKNKDVILIEEAGFIGPWGEMHSSAYEGDKYCKDVISTMLNYTPAEIKINVRTPHFYKITVGDLNNTQTRLGIYNDGYLGSATDRGTFNNEISRDDFVKWMEVHGKYTYYGGETSKLDSTDSHYTQEDEKYSNGDFAVSEAQKTHLTYLNSEYDENIIDNKWKKTTYSNSESEYNGETYYKYIQDHMGYRFVVRDSYITSSEDKGNIAGAKIKIENVGFGNIMKNKDVSVILRKDDVYYETNIIYDMTKLDSGSTNEIKFYFYIPSDIDSGDWDVCLKINNPNNENYSVRFANADTWENDIKANKIGKISITDNVAKEGVAFEEAFVPLKITGTKNNVKETVKTVDITFGFYYDSEETYSTLTRNIPLGTTVNFKDQASMDAINFSLPDGYKFRFAQWTKVYGDSDARDSITIPEDFVPEDLKNSDKWVNIFIMKDTDVKVTTTFYKNSDTENSISENELFIPYDTTIDFSNKDSLTKLGIIFPDEYSNYVVDYALSKDITGDWNKHTSMTIPKNIDKCNIEIYLKEDTNSSNAKKAIFSDETDADNTDSEKNIKVEMGFYKEGNEEPIDTTEIYVSKGTEIDYTNTDSLKNFGIALPSGTTFNYAQCYAIYKNWKGYQKIKIPSDSTKESYWINVYVK